MALIDVSELLEDPDFVDNLICIRRTEVVGNDGVPLGGGETQTGFVGSVQGDPDPRAKEAGGEYTRADMIVFTKFRLDDGKEGIAADIVRFNGEDYVVIDVSGWENWGEGYIKAKCVKRKLNG